MADTNDLDLRTPYFPIYSTTAPADILSPDISAIVGGSTPLLLPNEDWPRCSKCEEQEYLIPLIHINVSSPQTPSEFRQKVGVRPQPGHSVILQVLVCAEDESAVCFDESVVSGGGGDDEPFPAFLLRVLQLSPESINAAAVHAARAEMDGEKFFIEQRVIVGWTAGNPEMPHEAANFDYDEEAYQAHEPAMGLKLLGYPVQGKFYSSVIESCPRVRDEDAAEENDNGDAAPLHPSPDQTGPWRCLIQLLNFEDENTLLQVNGNTWVNQCEIHPDVLSMTIGGDW